MSASSRKWFLVSAEALEQVSALLHEQHSPHKVEAYLAPLNQGGCHRTSLVPCDYLETSGTLTPEKKCKYLQNSERCPYCGGENLNWAEGEFVGVDDFKTRVTCDEPNCGAIWWEYYKLYDLEEESCPFNAVGETAGLSTTEPPLEKIESQVQSDPLPSQTT